MLYESKYYGIIDSNSPHLMHHGIKGQKWGVRRWQYPDGVLTPAGRMHYGYGSNDAISKDASTSKSKNAPKHKKIIASAILNTYSKVKLSSALRGSDIGKRYADTYLKANTPMYRIQSNDNFENFAFYATYKQHDVDEYAGLFGKNLINRANAAAKEAKKSNSDDYEDLQSKADNMKVYQLKLVNNKKLKVPSEENASHIVGNLLKDADFRKDLSDSIKDSAEKMKRPSQQMLFKEAAKAMKKDANALNLSDKRNIYRALNLSLTNHNDYEVRAQNKFYGELKKYGYSALLDLNDKSYSSYHAKSPVIVFDIDKVKLQSVSTMDPKKVEKLYKKHNAERLRKDVPEQIIGNIAKYGEIKVSNISSYAVNAMDKYLNK